MLQFLLTQIGKLKSAVSAVNSKITAINTKTVVLAWGTYAENTHQLTKEVAIGKTVKMQFGANGRYVQYFTISGWGDTEQVGIMTDAGLILASFTDSTHIKIVGNALSTNPLKVVYELDGLVL